MSFDEMDHGASQGAAQTGSPGAAGNPKPLPKHARVESLRKRMLAPLASFAVVGAVIAALLVGTGGQHVVDAASHHHLGGSSAAVIPLPAPTTTSTSTETPTTLDTQPPPTIPATEPQVTVTSHRRTVHPSRVTPATDSVTPTTTVTSHPTATTTVTTVVSHPTVGTTVTTVTTITAHPTAGAAVYTPVTTVTTTTNRPASTTTAVPPTTAAPAPATTVAPAPPPASTGPVAFQEGAYVGAANPAGVTAFAAATHTKVTVGSDYLPGSNGWAGMDGAGGSISWLTNAWRGSGYTLSLGVPMFPTEPNGTPDGTLAQGATGAYNSYFTTLAQTLVAGGEANAYLRLGWEFDGDWYLWGATTASAEASYAAYFQQIVTAMRSVPGEAFRFVWNPDSGAFAQAGYNVELAWPGSSYVDVIGLDTYDQSWVTPLTPTNVWAETTSPGLNAAAAFAAAQGKPLAVDEWGVENGSDGHGLGDDPLFVNNFVAWMKSHNLAYESYFSNASGGGTTAITSGAFPTSLFAFIADLS
jgi:hypothetical protein